MLQSGILREREKVVFELLRRNLDQNEIAGILNVSIHTIKSYVSKFERMNLLKKDFINISVPEDFKNSVN